MTAKRFEINNDMILDDKVETYEFSCIVDTYNKSFYFVVDSIANVESFVERLNELHEEVENLKDVNTQCCNDYSAMRRDVLRYKEENEQLKKDVEYWKQVASQRCNEIEVMTHKLQMK
jgi:FtsZ-binding cell division protein ZapB